MKALRIIFGLLVIALGIVVCVNPADTSIIVVWIGACMFAVGAIVSCISSLAGPKKSTVEAILSILALIAAIIIIINLFTNPGATVATIESILIWVLLAFFLIDGIMTFVNGICIKGNAGVKALSIILGILMILLACFLLTRILGVTLFAFVINGLIIGVSLIVFGVKLFVSAFE